MSLQFDSCAQALNMDEGAKLWLLKYAKKQFWRVAAWVEFDDLVMVGFVSYRETVTRYPTAIEPAHRMRLFQLVFRSEIEDLVRAHRKQIDSARSDIVENIDNDKNSVMVLPDFSNFHSLMAKAPQQIKDVLSLFVNDSSREQLAKPFTRYGNGRRETLNDRFCRMLGYDPAQVDVVTMLKTYFSTT